MDLRSAYQPSMDGGSSDSTAFRSVPGFHRPAFTARRHAGCRPVSSEEHVAVDVTPDGERIPCPQRKPLHTLAQTAVFGDGPPDREGYREWKLSVSPVDRNIVAAQASMAHNGHSRPEACGVNMHANVTPSISSKIKLVVADRRPDHTPVHRRAALF